MLKTLLPERVLIVCLLFASCTSGPDGSITDSPARKNVVLIVADDHGQDTGAYGNSMIQTPNLDRLASEGVRFRHVFATTASCSASRSVILSGLQNHATGQYGHQHDFHHFVSFDRIKSLPVLLSEAGYRTGIVGTFHVAPTEVYLFDRFIKGSSRSSFAMADSAEVFIEESGDKPFFLYFATSDPHRGGGFADELEYGPDRFGNIPEGYPGIQPVTYSASDVLVPPFLPDTPYVRAELAQYYQAVSRVDQGVGHLMEVLEEAGVMDNTLIIYTSDHGIAFPGAKTTVYEPGLRIPLIVRHPDIRGGIVNDAMISMVDLTPTILDYAGVTPPIYPQHIGLEVLRPDLPDSSGLHGRSFLPILAEESPEGWDEVLASHTFHEIQMYYPMRSVRDREYKLIWNIAYQLPFPFAADLWESPSWQNVYSEGPSAQFGPRSVDQYINRPEFEFYDMVNDPFESKNLASSPEFGELVAQYKERLKELQRSTSDPWYLKWSYE